MLKFALVGCGRISKRHSELLGNNQIKGACLASVCDIDKTKAKDIASKFNISFYTDMHEMMKNEHIDVICVLTESGYHESSSEAFYLLQNLQFLHFHFHLRLKLIPLSL